MNDPSWLIKGFALFVSLGCLVSCGSHSVGLDIPGPWTQDVVYASNRGSNSVSAYQVNAANGILNPIPGSPFAAGAAPTGPMALASDYSGFVPNSGANSVSAFRISTSGSTLSTSTGGLVPLTGSPLATGRVPVALAAAYLLGALFIVNQTDNSISAYKGDVSMSTFTAAPGSPFATGTGPSAVTVGPAVYVVNRGSNSVSAFAVDATSAALSPIAGSPFATGSSPTNLAIDPNQKFAFVANNSSANVSAYLVGTGGALAPVAGSPFAAGTSPVSVSIWFAGGTREFVYVLNGGSNDISAFSVDPTTGVLAAVAGSPFATGIGPTFLAIDPTARFVYVANGAAASVSAYAVDATTGALRAVPGSPFACGSGPLYLTFDHAGNYLYVANGGSADISGFAISVVGGTTGAGALTALPGSPYAAGTSPDAVSTLTIQYSPSI